MGQPHLSDFIDVPPFVYLSGQLPFQDGKIAAGGIAPQTNQCLNNIMRVLESLDLGLSDVVKATVWLRFAADFFKFNEAYANFFDTHRPARTTVVSDLIVDNALIEIEVVVYRGANTVLFAPSN